MSEKTRFILQDAFTATLLITAATLFREPILAMFEAYDHPLNNIASSLLSRISGLPPLPTHDFVMGVGFAALGLVIAGAFSVLGVRRSWIFVGAVLVWLNLLWAYSVESEVASLLNRPLAESLKWSALSTYVANSIGSVCGSWLGALSGAKLRVVLRHNATS